MPQAPNSRTPSADRCTDKEAPADCAVRAPCLACAFRWRGKMRVPAILTWFQVPSAAMRAFRSCGRRRAPPADQPGGGRHRQLQRRLPLPRRPQVRAPRCAGNPAHLQAVAAAVRSLLPAAQHLPCMWNSRRCGCGLSQQGAQVLQGSRRLTPCARAAGTCCLSGTATRAWQSCAACWAGRQTWPSWSSRAALCPGTACRAASCEPAPGPMVHSTRRLMNRLWLAHGQTFLQACGLVDSGGAWTLCHGLLGAT